MRVRVKLNKLGEALLSRGQELRVLDFGEDHHPDTIEVEGEVVGSHEDHINLMMQGTEESRKEFYEKLNSDREKMKDFYEGKPKKLLEKMNEQIFGTPVIISKGNGEHD